MNRLLALGWSGLIVGMLAACASVPVTLPELPAPSGTVQTPSVPSPGSSRLPAPLLQPRSRWVAVPWTDLPGFADDALHEAWNAWIKSCERPGVTFAALCPDVRRLSIGSAQDQRDWMQARLQPYRVEPLGAASGGLLTGYFEPVFEASRHSNSEFRFPLYRVPAALAQRRPWYSRQEMEAEPLAQAALRGREIAFLADPVDAMILQIQGSGRLRLHDSDAAPRMVRLAFAGSNEQPYRSVGRWLLDQGAVRDASWPGIKAWLAENPQRIQELLWSNPRVVFFKEEPLTPEQQTMGPRGAQGVALTPGRSIAVDPQSIPYGTPVWLASSGAQVSLQRLVLAQDTGSAIVGANRADYFAGWDSAAAELAGRLKQPVQLWVLWPRGL